MDTEALDKLHSMIESIKVGMLVTENDEKQLHGRPLHTVDMDDAGALWFFIAANSGKIIEASKHGGRVNISYADASAQNYVSVSGTATLNQDKVKMQELWSPWVQVWFPRGVDDPNLGLLRVQMEAAEYWDAPGNMVTRVIGFVRALYGDKAGLGEHEKVDMK